MPAPASRAEDAAQEHSPVQERSPVQDLALDALRGAAPVAPASDLKALALWQQLALAWGAAGAEQQHHIQLQLHKGQASWLNRHGEWQRSPEDDRFAPTCRPEGDVQLRAQGRPQPAAWTSPLGLQLAAGALLMGLGLSWTELHHELLSDLPALQGLLGRLPADQRLGPMLDLMRAGVLSIAGGAALGAWQLSLGRAALLSSFIRSVGADEQPLRQTLRRDPLHWLPAAALAFVAFGALSGQLWLLGACCLVSAASAAAQLTGNTRAPQTRTAAENSGPKRS